MLFNNIPPKRVEPNGDLLSVSSPYLVWSNILDGLENKSTTKRAAHKRLETELATIIIYH